MKTFEFFRTADDRLYAIVLGLSQPTPPFCDKDALRQALEIDAWRVGAEVQSHINEALEALKRVEF